MGKHSSEADIPEDSTGTEISTETGNSLNHGDTHQSPSTLFMTGTRDMVLASSGTVDETHPMLAFQAQYVQTCDYHSLTEQDVGINKRSPRKRMRRELNFSLVSPIN